MIEVVKFLTANGFTVYVSGGTERYTMRPVVVEGLGLPPSHIIGSDVVVVSSNQNGAAHSELLHDFHINALGQVGEFTGCVSGADGFAEGVEDLASGLAVLGDP